MKITILLLFAILFSSCSNEVENHQKETIDVELLENGDLKLFDFVTQFEMIPLEFAGFESLVGIILKIDFINDHFHILSSNSSGIKSLHIFDQEEISTNLSVKLKQQTRNQ